MTDLQDVALAALRDNGFTTELELAARRELSALHPPSPGADVRDVRSLLWSSIDNPDSKDLDQIEFAEETADGSIRLLVGIADVDTVVTKGSALDQHAMANGTSVYTGISVYPMLPPEMSTNATSLNEGEERIVVVVEVVIAAEGVVRSHDVFRGLAVNRAKLAYDTVGAWLEGHGPIPEKIASTPGLEKQLWLQDRAASLLKHVRVSAGALEFDTIEATAVGHDGKVDAIAVTRKNRARDLIEDFMIAANVAIAQYLAEQNRSAIRRVVHEPKRWNRIVAIAATYGVALPHAPSAKSLASFLAERRAADPLRFADLSLSVVKLLGPGEYVVDEPGPADDEGHFGLAANDYSHATAPNRRYADLVTQRLVKAVLAKEPVPYSDEELAAIARHCTLRGECRERGRAYNAQVGGRGAPCQPHRRRVRRDRHWRQEGRHVRSTTLAAG